MTLTDPKPGGYAYGEKLPSSHINTVFGQQPDAIDGAGGGSYTLTGVLTLDGASTINIDGAGTLNITRPVATVGAWQFDTTTVQMLNGTTVTWTGSTNLPALGSRSYIYAQPLIAMPSGTITGGQWVMSTTNGTWTQANVGAAHEIAFPLTILPYKSTLDKVRVIIDGNYGGGGSHAGLPGTMPTVKLVKRTLTTNGYTVIGASVTDTPGTFANYDTPHVIYTAYDLHDGASDQWCWTGLGESIDGDKHFWVVVSGEADGGSPGSAVASALAVVGLEASFTCTQIAPG